MWNVFWMLNPTVRYLMDGLPSSHLKVVKDLFPAIVNDAVVYKDRFVDHPLNLADWLTFSGVELKCQAMRFRGDTGNLWERTIQVADRMLTEKPIVVRVDDKMMVRQHP